MTTLSTIVDAKRALQRQVAARLPIVVLDEHLVDLLEAETGYRLKCGDIVQDENGFGIARVRIDRIEPPKDAA